MSKYTRIKETFIKERRVVLTTKKGSFIGCFDGLDAVVEYIMENKLATGTKETVLKQLYRVANGKQDSIYRMIVYIEDVNGVTKSSIDDIISNSTLQVKSM